MYIPPRVSLDDDPLYPYRMTAVVLLGMALAIFFRSPMAPIYPSLMFGMMAGMRGAFNPVRALMGPIMFSIAVWLMSGVVTMFWSLPLLFIAVAALIMFAAFMLAMKAGNPAAMLLLASLVMMSILGLSNYSAMTLLREEMTKACLFTALAAPVLYYLFPTKATWFDNPVYAPTLTGNFAISAAIRTFALIVLCFWTYAVQGGGGIMLGIGACFVLIFPTPDGLRAEAYERTLATILGSGVGILVLFAVQVAAQPILLFGFTALATLFLSQKMATGRLPAMVYQFGGSAMISVATAPLSTSEPIDAIVTRVILTFGGAIAAVYLVLLLEKLLIRNKAGEPVPA